MTRAFAVAAQDEQPSIQEVPAGEPGPGQVLVAVEAASVNGMDAAVAAGYMWQYLPHEFPVVLGRDFAGTVASVGEGVTAWQAGDRVTGVITAMALGPGAITEQYVAAADSLALIPEKLTAAEAAASGLAGVTAVDMLAALAPTADDVVLVSGATGGVGTFLVQLLADTGATVIATARPGDADSFIRGLGAHQTVDHSGDLAAALADTPITAVIQLAGDPAALAALLPPGGRLISPLGATLEQTGRDDITVTAVLAVATPDKIAQLLTDAAEGRLAISIAGTHPFDQSTQALAAFSAPKLGKIVITVP
ncbi:NADP-dependent oxidoreductase [Acrocarpospora catenulata]|uniref:NADP-dependent oxidoreductase n=1 Tax=Acrocarpospora catenulata TaxID=2836182 RepID=UPI001BD965AE|nr:NADP-dependent oxidoreductase [Acrocarpospora catenulata]